MPDPPPSVTGSAAAGPALSTDSDRSARSETTADRRHRCQVLNVFSHAVRLQGPTARGQSSRTTAAPSATAQRSAATPGSSRNAAAWHHERGVSSRPTTSTHWGGSVSVSNGERNRRTRDRDLDPAGRPACPVRRPVDRRTGQGRHRSGVDAGARRGGTRPRGDHPRRQKGPDRQHLLHPRRWSCCSTRRSSFSSSSPNCSTAGSGDGWRSSSCSSCMLLGAAVLAPAGLAKVRRIRGSATDHRDGQGNPARRSPGTTGATPGSPTTHRDPPPAQPLADRPVGVVTSG